MGTFINGHFCPFYADVYFINTKQFNAKWGTSNPITLRDKEFGTIRIRGFGSYAYKVENPKIFLEELFGTNSTFLTNDISQYLKSMLISCISDAIAESKISALDMACNLMEFGEVTKENISAKFESLGLKIVNFVIENISFPEQVEKAIDTRSSMGVLGDSMDNYVRYTTVNAISDAAKNPNGNNLASTGVGLGSGIIMAEAMKEIKDGKSKKTSETEKSAEKKKATKAKFCNECGAELSSRAKFCSECGSKQINEHLCPECGCKVTATAKFCNECGAKLK